MGARPMARVIENEIIEPLSDEILFGKLKKGGKVEIDFDKKFLFKF
jgi:ATP-dependent Clp protease ATP-binding subunit ClpA